MRKRSTVFLAFLWLGLSGVLFSQSSQTYTGVGRTGLGANAAEARAQALKEALADVVRQAAGVYVRRSSVTQDAQAVLDEITTESEAYIENYEVLRDEPVGSQYLVIVEASVREQRLETAFSSRLSRFVEANPVGPCNFMISASPQSVLTQTICMINDPTLEMASVRIKMPGTDWITPTIYSQGVVNVARIDANPGATINYLTQVLRLMDGQKAHVRFRNPDSGEVTERELEFAGFTFLQISGIDPRIQYNAPVRFDAIPAEDRPRIRAALQGWAR